ncbi:hypothetical protein B194_0287 [Serratia plymuthica A30]|nr:hypothetical protein B194_0287 [Serratia plymuthica A30]
MVIILLIFSLGTQMRIILLKPVFNKVFIKHDNAQAGLLS